MVTARVMQRLPESSDPQPQHAIYLHVRPRLAPVLIVDAEQDVSRLSLQEFAVSMSGRDQTAVRWCGENPLSASDPTSEPFGRLSNKSEVYTS